MQLNTPIAFLVDNEYNFQQVDDKGWTVLHYFVIKNNLSKILEAFTNKIDLNCNSKTNNIDFDYLFLSEKEKEGINYLKIKDCLNIDLGKNGMTPLHLSVILYDFYKQKSKQKSHLDNETNLKIQDSIINLMLDLKKDSIFWQDVDCLSVTDYCLLTLNFELLKKIKKIDHDLNSLTAISYKTAQTICDKELELHSLIHSNKNTTIQLERYSNQEIETIREFSNLFKTKSSFETLNNKLTKKEECSKITKI